MGSLAQGAEQRTQEPPDAACSTPDKDTGSNGAPNLPRVTTGYNAVIGEATIGGGKPDYHGRFYLNLAVDFSSNGSALREHAPRLSIHEFSQLRNAPGEPVGHYGRHVAGVTMKPFTDYGEMIGEFRTLPTGLLREGLGVRINNPLSLVGTSWGFLDLTIDKSGKNIGAVLLAGRDLGKFGSAEVLVDHLQPWSGIDGGAGTHSELNYFIGRGIKVGQRGLVTPVVSIQRNDFPNFHQTYGTAGFRLQLLSE